MTYPKRSKWCGDCEREDDYVNWCDICRSFVCIDCDALHDCLSGPTDEEPETEEAPTKEDDFYRLFGLSKKEDGED